MSLLFLAGPSQASEEVVRLPVEQVIVTTDRGDIAFATEIATTDETRSRGLMFRRSMGEREAMLFHWPSPRLVSMWMRNTYLSLDMLFVAADGLVVHVQANTVPQSLDVLSAGREVTAVMELVAGTAAKLGIRPGSRLKHRFFNGS
ncbi:MAG: DUF192 domain-containing protein [Anderseniella sp.]|nr:DUF192 domain-containing protein [Anderseniella sp.]